MSNSRVALIEVWPETVGFERPVARRDLAWEIRGQLGHSQEMACCSKGDALNYKTVLAVGHGSNSSTGPCDEIAYLFTEMARASEAGSCLACPRKFGTRLRQNNGLWEIQFPLLHFCLKFWVFRSLNNNINNSMKVAPPNTSAHPRYKRLDVYPFLP